MLVIVLTLRNILYSYSAFVKPVWVNSWLRVRNESDQMEMFIVE